MTDVRVIVVDDHAVVRKGYRGLLERTSDIEVIAEAASGEEAYQSFCEKRPDVIVMDINLPGMSGIEATPGGEAGRAAGKVRRRPRAGAGRTRY